jgi:hypothetical protein
VKLFIAGVAALSMFSMLGCATDVGTSGDNEINVAGTKSSENPREKALVAGIVQAHFDVEDVRFSERLGTWAESLIPDNMERACVNCDLLFVHNSDGRIDDTEIWTGGGEYVCHVRQTSTHILANTCKPLQ